MPVLQIDFKDPERKCDVAKLFQTILDTCLNACGNSEQPSERMKSSISKLKLEEEQTGHTSSLVRNRP